MAAAVRGVSSSSLVGISPGLELTKFVRFARQQREEFGIQEQLVKADSFLLQNTDSHKLLKICRRCLPFGYSPVHDILDAAIGLIEYQFNQLATVLFGGNPAGVLGGVFDKASHSGDLCQRPLSGFLSAAHNVQNPIFPSSGSSNREKAVMVRRLIANDRTGQIQDRLIKQPVLDQYQEIQDTARSAIAVGERVNGLKLVVRNGHS